MRFFQKQLFILIIPVLLFASCEYKIEEVYFKEVEKPTTYSDLEVDLNISYSDTINFYWYEYVEVKFMNENIDIYEMKFYLNNIEIKTCLDDDECKVGINLEDFNTYIFNIDIITSTGSHSLSDDLGVELVIYNSKDWYFNKKLVNEETNYSYIIENGNLILTWKKYDGIAFEDYTVDDQLTYHNESFEQTENFIIIENYEGQYLHYEIYVNTSNRTRNLWSNCKVRN